MLTFVGRNLNFVPGRGELGTSAKDAKKDVGKLMRSFFLISSFVLVALFSRWLPHPANFTAFGALALFSGALLGNRFAAVALPLAALVVSDLVMGFHSTFLWVYLGFALTALLGSFLQPQENAGRALVGSFAASFIFFAVSNFGVWIVGGLYPLTLEGLVRCYEMAIPFMRNQVLGDLLFVAAFYVVAKSLSLGFVTRPQKAN